MNRQTESGSVGLNDTWLKAAALGCLWASTEMTLGGFLHNLRIPMAGNIMAAVGIVLMISVGSLWPVRGLFWRAGLICALMKSLAPTAVIFGPMLAISSQAFLMELAVRTLHRHAASYLLGAMLAMSWNMVQFLINTLLAYGSNALDVYRALVLWAHKSLGMPMGQDWLPVMLMLTGQLLLGLLAGCLGLHIGHRALREPLQMSSLTKAQVLAIRAGKANSFSYSGWWLLGDGFLLVLTLILTGYAPWTIWLPVGGLVMVIWGRRYRHGVRPLLRWQFWLWFIIITVMSGALLGSLKQGWNGLLPGLMTGLAMNFRAAVLLLGFSALGTELRSPSVGRRLSRGRFSQLPGALEAAVETLPWVMANLPRLSETFRRPITIFHQVVAQAEFWLKRLTLRQARRKMVFLLCGQVGQGKSGLLNHLLEELRREGLRVSGFLSPSVHRAGERIGYDLIDLHSGERCELSRVTDPAVQKERPRVGLYTFRPRGIAFGLAALALEKAEKADLVLVDEVGPWELCDQGWAKALYELTLSSDVPMIWVVRADIVDQVAAHWGLEAPQVAQVGEHNAETLFLRVKAWLPQDREGQAVPAAADNPGDGRHPG